MGCDGLFIVPRTAIVTSQWYDRYCFTGYARTWARHQTTPWQRECTAITSVDSLLDSMRFVTHFWEITLHPRILKELAKEISKPLQDIFTTSLREGKLPGDWRIAHITPIHKKGSKTEAGNYRPVSLTSILCKIMEGVIRDKVVNHMKENKLFSKDQHGFMNGRSTVTQLLETLEYWSMHLDSGLGVDAIYLDFQKAFDSVPYQRLLKKVRSYGVCDHVYKWIESFLKERRQRVTVNRAESNWAIVESGIPQGSVLGPILFIIFINDMPGETVCPLKLFADDAKLFHCVTSENDCKALQDDLDKLQEWAKQVAVEVPSKEVHSAESRSRPPRIQLLHVGWKWTSQAVRARDWKRPRSPYRQIAEIRTPHHNNREKGQSNGRPSVENIRVHRQRNVHDLI